MGERTLLNISLSQPTGNFWVDTGLVVLNELFQQETLNLNEALKTVVFKLQTDRGGWIYPANNFINTQAKPLTFPSKLKRTKGKCDVCTTEDRYIEAKMWMYPFIVDPSKFGTFYPGTKRGLRLCARCTLAGLAGYLGWLWKAHGKDTLHFFVFYSPDLRELQKFHRVVLGPLKLEGGKAPTAFSGPYLYETTLGLLLELFSHVEKSDLLSEEGRNLLSQIFGEDREKPPTHLHLYVISGKPGRAFNMHELREFSRLHDLYRLYKKWKEALVEFARTLENDEWNPHSTLAGIFSQFQIRRDQQYDTLWRDRISRSVLQFQDPFPFIEGFLFEARAKEKRPGPLNFGTMEVFKYYAKEVLNMDEQLLKTLAGFGHHLGRFAQDKSEMGLLYALRNAKNADEFFKVLNDIQFRLELDIPEVFLAVQPGEKIQGSPWKRVKTLLSIFAMNAYLWAQQGAKKKEEVNA